MASINASRRGIEQKVNDAVSEARLIGFDDSGRACVWFGGYGFNVYDAARDWDEVDHFTSGDLAGLTDARRQDPDAYRTAQKRMEAEGFTVIR